MELDIVTEMINYSFLKFFPLVGNPQNMVFNFYGTQMI